MKKILLFAAASLLLFAACSNEDPIEPPFFAIDGQTSANIENNETTFYIKVSSSSPAITATPSMEWINVLLRTSDELEKIYTYEVTIRENTSDEVRNGKITFAQNETGATATFNITQGQAPKTLETVGIYVLTEGDYGSNNGKLIYFDFNKTNNTFVKNDGRKIGRAHV